MKDELISYETAVLAKEKGFNEFCEYYITESSVEYQEGAAFKNEYGYVTAPTQSLLQRWLREVHYIVVESNYKCVNDRWAFYFNLMIMGYTSWLTFDTDLKGFTTYEEALEEGLKQALNLIK